MKSLINAVLIVLLFPYSGFGADGEVSWDSSWIPSGQYILENKDIEVLENLVDLVSPTFTSAIEEKGVLDGLAHHMLTKNPREEVDDALDLLEERGHWENGWFENNFLNSFRFCSAEEARSVRGMIRYGVGYHVVGVSFYGEERWKDDEGVMSYFRYPPAVRDAIDQLEQDGRPVLSVEEYHPIYILHYRKFTDICIKRDSTLLQAMGTFVHELIHVKLLTYTNPFFEILEKYSSQKDYAEKAVDELGNESDAHISQYRAMALAKGSKEIIPPKVRDLYDDDMVFKDSPENRKEMAAFVLGPRGYRGLFNNDYVEIIVALYNNLNHLKSLIASYKTSFETSKSHNSYYRFWGEVFDGDLGGAGEAFSKRWTIGSRLSSLESLEEKVDRELKEIERRIESESLPVKFNN